MKFYAFIILIFLKYQINAQWLKSDHSFGNESVWKFTPTAGINNINNYFKVLKDSSILVFTTDYDFITFRIRLFHLMPNGKPDLAYGDSGMQADSFVLLTTQKIFPVFTDSGTVAVCFIPHLGSNNGYLGINKYTAHGKRDTGFGNNGQQFINMGSNFTNASTGVFGKNGELFILCENAKYTNGIIYKLKPEGKLDSAFGKNGSTLILLKGWQCRRVKLQYQQNNKLMMGCMESASGKDVNHLIRLNAINGSPDSTFGTNGIVTFDVGISQNDVSMIASNTFIYFSYVNDNSTLQIKKFDTIGKLDTSFGNKGTFLNSWGTRLESPLPMIIEEDGSLIAGATLLDGVRSLLIMNVDARGKLASYRKNKYCDFLFQNKLKIEINLPSLHLQYPDKLLIGYDGYNSITGIEMPIMARFSIAETIAPWKVDSSITKLTLVPNPSSGNFEIQFSLSATDVVTIEILDATGKQVAIPMFNYYLTAGFWNIPVSLEQKWKSGIYLVRMQSGNQNSTQKLVIN